MKTAVVFYSWSGHTSEKAKALAKKEQAKLFEIKDTKKPNPLAAYTLRCFAALRMKRTPTSPFTAPFKDFDRIVFMAPVWAGHLRPPSSQPLMRCPAESRFLLFGSPAVVPANAAPNWSNWCEKRAVNWSATRMSRGNAYV